MVDTGSIQIIEVSGVVALAIISLSFGVQKLLKGWKETSTESSVLTMMHTELERMSSQNTKLSDELNKLQLELVKLNKELFNLTLENQRLHGEVAALTEEIVRLKTKLDSKGEYGTTSKG